jgi:hypothetical protein
LSVTSIKREGNSDERAKQRQVRQKQIERCVISIFRIAESMGFKGEFRQWEDLLRIGEHSCDKTKRVPSMFVESAKLAVIVLMETLSTFATYKRLDAEVLLSSRARHSSGVSPSSTLPPGNSQNPASFAPHHRRGKQVVVSERASDRDEYYNSLLAKAGATPATKAGRAGQSRRILRLSSRQNAE